MDRSAREFRTVRRWLAAGSMLLGSWALPAAAETAAVEPDFSAMAIYASMDGFTFARTGQGAPGQWEVIAEPSAKLGLVFAQTARTTLTTDFRWQSMGRQ
jgi:hypothetical protein